jgi:hypothetical protein
MRTVIVETNSSSFGIQKFSVVTTISNGRVAISKAVGAVLLEHFNFDEDELRDMCMKYGIEDPSVGSFSIGAMCGSYSVILDTLTA